MSGATTKKRQPLADASTNANINLINPNNDLAAAKPAVVCPYIHRNFEPY
jgi:hypothetical protein